MKLVGVEEHYVTEEILEAWRSLDPRWQDLALTASGTGETGDRLRDLGPQRIEAMRHIGLDVQVVSLMTPGVQNLAAPEAAALQEHANDVLSDAVRRHPDELQALAALPTPSPQDAARELERTITELGFNGAIVFGRTREDYLDESRFWPILEAANALRAPLHLHPQSPLPQVRSAYYGGFSELVDGAFATHRLGWHYETGVQLVRLVLSGAFDRFPDLRVVLGHWGEVVVFYLERLELLATFAKLPLTLTEYVHRHVFVAPGGMFSQRYLRWAIDVMGVDRILLSTDYPFEPAPPGGARRFLADAELSDAQREQIASGNWERLCGAIRR